MMMMTRVRRPRGRLGVLTLEAAAAMVGTTVRAIVWTPLMKIYHQDVRISCHLSLWFR